MAALYINDPLWRSSAVKTTIEYMSQVAYPVLQSVLIAEFDKKIGILSLSEVPDSLVMWSHYADQHRGIVIEFDGSHSTFNCRPTPKSIVGYLGKVVYTEHRPTALDQHNETSVLLTKASDWYYEKEWQIFKSLENTKVTVCKQPFNIHLLEMPANCIKRVIFGARISLQDVRDAVKKIRSCSNLAHVRLTRAVRRRVRFALDLDVEV